MLKLLSTRQEGEGKTEGHRATSEETLKREKINWQEGDGDWIHLMTSQDFAVIFNDAELKNLAALRGFNARQQH